MLTTKQFPDVLHLPDDGRTITEAGESALWAFCHQIGKYLGDDPDALVFHDLDFAREWIAKTFPGREVTESRHDAPIRLVKGIFEDNADILTYILKIQGEDMTVYVVDYAIRMD